MPRRNATREENQSTGAAQTSAASNSTLLDRKSRKGASIAGASITSAPLDRASLNIVLAGNPNVGKSVIFNALTGMKADVSNYPGTTIDVAKSTLGADTLVDTPGVYGVSSFNDEERAARKLIVNADIVVNIVSGLSLERDLFLTLQLIDMGKPLLLVINQWDEAIHRGLKIDIDKLSNLLDVPVMTCVAVRKQGIEQIKANIELARPGKPGHELMSMLRQMMEELSHHAKPHHEASPHSQAHALLILEGDETSAGECDTKTRDFRAQIYKERRDRVNTVIEECVSSTSKGTVFSVKLGRWLLHPVAGTISAIAVCWLIFYQLLGVFVAGDLVGITEEKIMQAYYEPHVRRVAANIFPCAITAGDTTFQFPNGTLADKPQAAKFDEVSRTINGADIQYNFWTSVSFLSIIGNILVGEYGLLTLTVTYLLGLLMPLVLGFYFGLAILEDSGYLPRLAVLVDRLLSKIGLNGRAIIPLILGLGCVTMATITTRLLTTRREKIIATALLGVAIPCSAQLGVVSGTLAKIGGLYAWIVYGGVVAAILGLTGLLLNMVLPGKSGSLIMDLPPMRLPRYDNVLKKTWSKSWNFLQDAAPAFFLAGLVVSIAQMTGVLDMFIRVLQPITVSWLQLPNDPRIATTFILGIVRRDFASFGLTEVPMTAVQAVTAMIVITLFVPCIATVGVMTKERGAKIAMTIWLGSWLSAFLIGGALCRALPALFALVGL